MTKKKQPEETPQLTRDQFIRLLSVDSEVDIDNALKAFFETLTPEQIKQLEIEADLQEFDEVFIPNPN